MPNSRRQDAAGFGTTPSLAAGIEKPFPSRLEPDFEIHVGPIFALASLRMRRKARASCSHAIEDLIVASRSLSTGVARD